MLWVSRIGVNSMDVLVSRSRIRIRTRTSGADMMAILGRTRPSDLWALMKKKKMMARLLEDIYTPT